MPTETCRYCPNLDRSWKITCTITGKTYTCKKNFTCRSSHFVYGITCHTCNKQYVGQPTRTILERFQGHYANTKKALKNPGTWLQVNPNAHTHHGNTIGLHFAEMKHKGTADFKIQVLESISLPQTVRRLWTWDSKRRNSGYIDSAARSHKGSTSWSKHLGQNRQFQDITLL